MISNRLGTTTAISLVTTCMCTCACMHATHIHHIHTHTYTHAYNTYTSYTYTYIYTCIHTHTYTYTYIYIHIHIHTHTYTHACNTYTSYTYTYIYIHIHIHTHTHSLVTAVLCGTQTDMPRRGACCVQKLDDSQIHADRTTYRTLLRSSSMQEPRDPLLKVVLILPTTFSLCQTPASVNIKPASSRRSVRANVCVCVRACAASCVPCRVVPCRAGINVRSQCMTRRAAACPPPHPFHYSPALSSNTTRHCHQSTSLKHTSTLVSIVSLLTMDLLALASMKNAVKCDM